MYFPANETPKSLNKTLWAQLISPRPIALIATIDPNGDRNIAPFNSYTGLSTYPPLLGIAFGRRGGTDKHTLRNIRESGVFSINLVPRFLSEIMNEAARETESADDFERLSLTAEPCASIDGFRIVESPATLECRLIKIVALEPSTAEFVVAQVEGIRIRDEFALADGGFDNLSADLLASAGREDYITVNGELLHLPALWE